MSFGHPSYIAAHLLGEDLAPFVVRVQAETALYGSTTGPWGGFGGAAMSVFTMTYLMVHAPSEYAAPAGSDTVATPVEVALFFSDEALLGWAQGEQIQTVLGEFPHLRDDMPALNTDASACPLALPKHLTAANRGAQTAPSTEGASP